MTLKQIRTKALKWAVGMAKHYEEASIEGLKEAMDEYDRYMEIVHYCLTRGVNEEEFTKEN